MFKLYHIINTQFMGYLSQGQIAVGLTSTCYHGCCLVGLRALFTRALSMAKLIIASCWPAVQTTMRNISRFFRHIPAMVTCSTYSPWRQIWQTLHKVRVMVLMNLWLQLLLTRRVKLVLVYWESDTLHGIPCTTLGS
jgi:hypothetical protein